MGGRRSSQGRRHLSTARPSVPSGVEIRSPKPRYHGARGNDAGTRRHRQRRCATLRWLPAHLVHGADCRSRAPGWQRGEPALAAQYPHRMESRCCWLRSCGLADHAGQQRHRNHSGDIPARRRSSSPENLTSKVSGRKRTDSGGAQPEDPQWTRHRPGPIQAYLKSAQLTGEDFGQPLVPRWALIHQKT